MSTIRPQILVLLAHYLPGEKSGGPVWSIAGLVEALREEFDFRILTRDRDLAEDVPYENVSADVWSHRDGVTVRYLSPRGAAPWEMRRLLQTSDCDLIYLNSLFAPRFSILPVFLRRLGLIPNVPLLVAPRGELSAGALALRSSRKRMFLWLANALDFYRDVHWLASTALEADEIRAAIRHARQIGVAMDFGPAARSGISPPAHAAEKKPGQLSAVFISRICRKKNLTGALETLGTLTGDVKFSIYGPLEDAVYFAECERLISQLPANVEVRYMGIVPHEDIEPTFARHDLFLFPTYGENYGHVIYEALNAGCPALLSDRTPWLGLEAASAGWDLPLDDLGAFSSVLQHCVDAGPEEWNRMRAGARSFARTVGGRDVAIEQHRQVLREASART